ncbi:MAG: HEAT repeat domain-containing protein, partial [Bacteroidota bacterium]|nr:HEAT repeat domain-containing protein [Bacteroidota bacterium]
MKLKFIPLILLLVALVFNVSAQDNRTDQTKVADVLALFPAQTNADADRLYKDLVSLSDGGLDLLTSRVLPNGKEEGVPARYAVALMTHHASSKSEKARIESAYLRALDQSDNTEVKAYFIDNLKIVGSNASVKALSQKITEEGLSQQAISALVSIGTPDARTALQSALEKNSNGKATARLIQALGELKHQPATHSITKFAASDDVTTKKHALWSLALIADASSYNTLLQQARNVHFKNDPSEATHALVEYIHQLSEKGNRESVASASQELLSNTLEADQQHFRLAALKALAKAQPEGSTKILIKELNRFDPKFQKEVLKIASFNVKDKDVARQWLKVYKKNSTLKAGILSMLAAENRSDAFIEETILPALRSKDASVRIAAAEEIAYSDNKKFQAPMIDYLLNSNSEAEIAAARTALLRMMDEADAKSLAGRIASAAPANKAAVISILGERRAVDNFDIVFEHTSSGDASVRSAAYAALPKVSSSRHVSSLLTLLGSAKSEEETKSVQAALIASLDKNSHSLVNDAYAKNKARILPLLPYVNDDNALQKVTDAFKSGSSEEKAAAFNALLNWQDHAAARTLLAIRKDPALKQYHEKAFQALVSQVGQSAQPDEQKLLMLDAAMNEAGTSQEKNAVIRAAGSLRTFLALMFVSQYLDDKDLERSASRSVMQIALPTADARPGLTGTIVRNTLQKILDKLEGQDSQYEVIDIQTYLDNMPYTKGYESIFNGKDLSGWQGLVENPIARSKMTAAELAKKQAEANEKLKESW